MPTPLVNTAEAWDLATRQIQRERLQQAVRSQRLRIGAVYGLDACVAGFAVAALAYGALSAALLLTLVGCLLFGFTYFASIAGKQKLAASLRELDPFA